MKRACIIIPYYGKWPPYMKLFLNSCSFNPELTILIFTDLEPPPTYPSNVTFHTFTLAQIKASLDEALNINSALTTPYKLCDVRPAYGLIFNQYIKEYDFWGWGDVDVLYGCINDFGLHNLFDQYDVISFRKTWLSGSFCFVKNNEMLRRLFLTSSDKVEIFSSPDYKGFDEISLCWEQITTVPFDEIKWPSDNFTRIVLEASKNDCIKLYFNDLVKESIPEDGYLLWHNGQITDRRGQSYPYYHFVTEKKRLTFVYPRWDQIPEKFYINTSGFYTEKEFEKRRWIEAKRLILAIPKLVKDVGKRMVIKLAKCFNYVSLKQK